MTTTDPRTASVGAAPIQDPLSGPGTLNGHPADDAQTSLAVEGQDSPQANSLAVPKHQPPAGNTDPRTAKVLAAPTDAALSGPGPLNGQAPGDTQASAAVEGRLSPQARDLTQSKDAAPAGNTDTRTATSHPAPKGRPLSGPDVLNGQPM